MNPHDDTELARGDKAFPPTSWTLLLACRDRDDPASRAGLEELFGRYWKPVYFFVRRNAAATNEEAKDLTQAYFAAFLEKGLLERVDPDRGRFRNFLCATLRHFVSDTRRRGAAGKRRPPGGLLSLGALDGAPDPPAPSCESPEAQFRADWRRAVLEAAFGRFEERARSRGKGYLIEILRAHDLDHAPGHRPSYAELAREAGLTVHQVTVGLAWARQELRRAVVEEVGDQVDSAAERDAELEALFGEDDRT